MKAIGYVATTIVAALTTGFVTLTLWSWFVLTQFEGAPKLSLPGAIGLGALVHYLTMKTPTIQEIREKGDVSFEDSVTNLLIDIGVSIFVLAIGFVVHLFM